jgi:hypothetical protein
MDRFLPAAFADGREWMALRQLDFGCHVDVVPRPLRERLSSLGLIDGASDNPVVTEVGRKMLSLGAD